MNGVDFGPVTRRDEDVAVFRLVVGIGLATLLIVLVRTAWVCDDAYISFRTADNFVNGYGLRWNVSERVQAYTHPLWLAVFTAVYAFTREAYFTSILLSIGLSIGAVVLLVTQSAHAWTRALVVFAVLLSSKAFVDFSTSGLENALTYVLLVAFLYFYWREPSGARRPFRLSLTASLCLLNRLDLLFLVAPAIGIEVWRSRSQFRGTWHAWILGATPLVAWEMFACVYYGTPLPNTAYAKVLGAHASAFALFRRGLFYGRATALFDPVTMAVIALAPLAIVARERWRDWPLLAGIVAHGLYVTYVGGDFMFGRFYTPLLVWSVALLARTPWLSTGRVAAVVATGFVALGLTAPDQPALLSGYHGWTPFPRTLWFQGESVDERQHYFAYTGLLNQRSGGVHPAPPWAYQGLQLRGTGSRRVTWIDNIGFAGYFSGPHVHIIDRYGLADPLMARIPIDVTTARVGHFVRELPAGYQESIESGDNRIADPHLARFYDRLRLVVSGPIWDRRRLATIVWLLMGRYDSDVRAYAARSSPSP